MLTNTHQDYINKISKILEDLEEKGEIMILSQSSEIISKLIIHSNCRRNTRKEIRK